MSGHLGYLRVYQPLDGLAEPERETWAAYVATRRSPSLSDGTRAERRAAIAALLGTPPRLPDAGCDGEAFVLRDGDRTLICPWWTRLRAVADLVAFREDTADPACFGLPARVQAQFAAAEARIVRDHPQARPGVRSSATPVPLGWLLLFDAGERAPEAFGGAGERAPEAFGGAPAGQAPPGADRALVYRTAMVRARQRAARALHTISRVLAPAAFGVSQLEDAARWLEEFHPHSVVELDLGESTGAAGRAGIDAIADLQSSLTALHSGDLPAARAAYLRVCVRWRELAAVQTAN
jgi:hypothetical protein